MVAVLYTMMFQSKIEDNSGSTMHNNSILLGQSAIHYCKVKNKTKPTYIYIYIP